MFGARPNYAVVRRLAMLSTASESPIPHAPEKRVAFADELGAHIDDECEE
jgi:hypothetical protein